MAQPQPVALAKRRRSFKKAVPLVSGEAGCKAYNDIVCAFEDAGPVMRFTKGPSVYFEHVLLKASLRVIAKTCDWGFKMPGTLHDIFKLAIATYSPFAELTEDLVEADLECLLVRLCEASKRGMISSPDV